MSIELTLFLILGIMAAASALAVITRKNPITASMFLVMHFISLAGLYLTLHAQFMAAIQILVYAGAIMVLVVFVIMLLNLGSEESLGDAITSRQGFGVAGAILLGSAIIFGLTRSSYGSPVNARFIENGKIETIGKALFTTYVFPFEMISLVLLAAAVGAVVLTKRHID